MVLAEGLMKMPAGFAILKKDQPRRWLIHMTGKVILTIDRRPQFPGPSLRVHSTLITWPWFLPDCDPKESKAKAAVPVTTKSHYYFCNIPLVMKGSRICHSKICHLDINTILS